MGASRNLARCNKHEHSTRNRYPCEQGLNFKLVSLHRMAKAQTGNGVRNVCSEDYGTLMRQRKSGEGMIATAGMDEPFISPPAPPSLCGLRARERSGSTAWSNLVGGKNKQNWNQRSATRIHQSNPIIEQTGLKRSNPRSRSPTNEGIEQPTTQQPVPSQPRGISSPLVTTPWQSSTRGGGGGGGGEERGRGVIWTEALGV